MLVTSITEGRAKIVISEATSMAHRNSGMRPRVIPGGRSRMMVAKVFTDADKAATSVKVIICAQTSARWPGA